MPKPQTHILETLVYTFRGYRKDLLVLVGLGSLGALLDGISVNAIIPLVTFVIGAGAQAPTDTISTWIHSLFTFLHVPFQFKFLLMFIATLVIVRAISQAFFVFMRARINTNFITESTRTLLSQAFFARWSFIAREKSGHIQNTIVVDARRTAQLLDVIVQFIQSGTGFLMYLLVAINIAPGVTLVTLVAGGILLMVFRPLIKKTRRFGEEMSRAEKDLAQHIAEYLTGFKTVKSMGVAQQVYDSGDSYLVRLSKALRDGIFVQSLGSIVIQPFGFLFAMAIFAFMFYTLHPNVGIIAAILYLVQKIFVYLDSTQSSLNSLANLVPFADNIRKFSERAHAAYEQERKDGVAFAFENELVFEGVSLCHDNEREVLRDISFTIEKGAFVGIIGPSGGGKTTLADLVLRLFEPTTGSITLDGVPVGEIQLAQWRHRVGYVSQDAFLMHASVRDNIRFFDDTISDADIESAMKDAHIYEEIMQLPEGLDTVLGDRGVRLSGGQRQRVALARALARKPSVLVLDEVTSALDSELEREIKRVIEALRGRITLISIAHRVSTILDADTIVVLKDGAIEASGTPESMLVNPDSYLSHILSMQGRSE